MKKPILLFWSVVLLIAFPSWGYGQEAGCDSAYKGAISALYAVAMTNPDDFPNFVNKNRDFLFNNSQLRSCFERFATALRVGALAGPSVNDIQEEAYDMANKSGAPEMGDALYKQMLETKSDMLTLARHLNSLSESIQEICKGNLSTYHNSEVYKLSTFMWSAMKDAWGWQPGAVDKWRRTFFNMYDWYIGQLAKGI